MRRVQERYSSWTRALFAEAYRARTPVTGSLALTHRCNLGCVHCYLQESRGASELETATWLDILDQLERAGCLWLMLTGGEPLLRSDFAEIYTHARRRGFLVSVFTNGTLVDDALLDLFTRFPPHCVEISLYGHSERVYAAVTGDAGARSAAYAAVDRLHVRGVPLRIKTVALRQNVHEIEMMRRCADRLDSPFRFDPLITPCLDGSARPCSTRLDDESIVRLDLDDGMRREAWRERLQPEMRAPRSSLFTCGAGMTSFHVHPDGLLALCLSDVPLHDLATGSFQEGWDGVVHERRETPLPDGHTCGGCRDQAFCGVCPALARMETGSDLGVPEDLCRTGKRRLGEVEARVERP